MSNSKECPFCGEEILLKAIKCKHCYSMLENNSQTPSTPPPTPPKPSFSSHVSSSSGPPPPPPPNMTVFASFVEPLIAIIDNKGWRLGDRFAKTQVIMTDDYRQQ